MRAHFVSTFCLLLASLPLRAQIAPNIVLVHGKIWAENPQQPEAEAIAILGDRIAVVGTSAEILKLTGPATKVVDLGGKRVVPGFNDAHVHFDDGGTSLASVQLGDARSEAEFRQRIADYAKANPKALGFWRASGTTSGGHPRSCQPINSSMT